MNKITPKVSVIIPVYNSEKYLFEALESIRVQTFEDFECIVLNDGSTDKSQEIIQSFVEKDDRFILINKTNEGVGRTLKLGVSLAKSDLIARMDSDDISKPRRLEIQYNYLSKNQNVIVVGSGVQLINEKGRTIRRLNNSVPKNNLQCKWTQLRAGIPFSHPSVMFRKNNVINVGSYTTDLAEDFILWLKLFDYQFANIKSKLIKYRLHSKQVSSNFEKNHKVFEQISDYLNLVYSRFGLDFQIEIVKFLYNYRLLTYDLDSENQKKFYRYLVDLKMKFLFSFKVKKLKDRMYINVSLLKQGIKVYLFSKNQRKRNFAKFSRKLIFMRKFE